MMAKIEHKKMEFLYKFILGFVLWLGMWNWVKLSEVFFPFIKSVYFLKFIIFEDKRSLVDIDQLANISFRFFVKWAQLFLFISQAVDTFLRFYSSLWKDKAYTRDNEIMERNIIGLKPPFTGGKL